MEAAGHYYTVYYMSLAVGFSHRQAKEFAFFAQMPDQISELDATDLELNYAKAIKAKTEDLVKNDPRTKTSSQMPLPLQAGILAKVIVEDGIKAENTLRDTDQNKQRFQVERTLHSLTGKNAQQEQQRTVQLLRDTFNDHFDLTKFGFLLHRLGDTFAHTRLGQTNDLNFETGQRGADLYRSSYIFTDIHGHGHAEDGTFPDHPWQRATLFLDYIRTLYSVLLYCLTIDRANQINYSGGEPGKKDRRTYSIAEVETVFKEALRMAAKEYGKQYLQLTFYDQGLYMSSRVSSGVRVTIKEMETKAEAGFKLVLFDDMYMAMNIIPDTYAPETEALLAHSDFAKKYADKHVGTLDQSRATIGEIDTQTQSTN